MEAASVTPIRPERRSVFAALRSRRRDRRVRRMLADAERFERAASRLEQQLEPTAWQVAHLRRSADELRALAGSEQRAA